MRWLPSLFCSAFAGLSALPAQACEIALVLAVDVSGSVDAQEYDTQMLGLAEALRDGSISEALVVRQAAVQLIQWTGTHRQRVSIPWRRIRSFEDTDQLAEDIENAQRIWRNFSTAIGEALIYAQHSFAEVQECQRWVIDVSGDGKSNEGIEPSAVHAQLKVDGIIVNGLAIEQSDKSLTAYYESDLITGAGSFAVRADTFEQYPERIKRKLLREITKQVSTLPYDHDMGKL